MNSAAAQVPAQRLPPATGGVGGDGERDRVESRLSGLLSWKTLVIGACVAFTIYIAVVPLGFLLWQSFFTPQTATKAAVFTFDNYITAHTSSDTARLVWNSVRFAVGTATLAFFIGATLAWINERTNTPFKSLFFALSLIPLVIPGILFTVAWMLLASPKIGIINLVLQSIFNLDGADRIFKAIFSFLAAINTTCRPTRVVANA